MLEDIINLADRVVQTITPILNNIVAAFIIIFVGFVTGKVVGGFMLKILQDGRVDQTSKLVLNKNISIAKNVSTFISYIFYIGAIIVALNTVRITSFVIGTLIFIFVAVILISLSIALKDFIPNLIVGIRLRKKKRYSVGRKLSFKGITGKIMKRTITQIIVQRTNGDLFILPNKLFRERT